VIAAPITSGDTAFRSARLITADFLNYGQKKIKKRLFIAIPLFIAGFILLQVDFDIIWRYFAWANQMLAAATLWVITVYLAKEQKLYWITLIPSLFMTMVVSTYIVIAPEGLRLPHIAGYLFGGVLVLALAVVFFWWYNREQKLKSSINF
jgi:carbon starvation protein CstA